jgi:hypothetical protein
VGPGIRQDDSGERASETPRSPLAAGKIRGYVLSLNAPFV